MSIQTIGADEGSKPVVTAGGKRPATRFWVPLVWAAVPALLVTLFTCLCWRYYEPPEFVVGVLFFAVVIPAAVICEKLGFGQFSVLGGSTVPDWLFYSVMMVVVYLHSLVLVGVGRWLLRAFSAKRAK